MTILGVGVREGGLLRSRENGAASLVAAARRAVRGARGGDPEPGGATLPALRGGTPRGERSPPRRCQGRARSPAARLSLCVPVCDPV